MDVNNNEMVFNNKYNTYPKMSVKQLIDYN